MNKIRFPIFIFIFFFSTKNDAQYMFQFYSDTVIKWSYFFGDEFEKHSLDENKWTSGYPWGKTLFSQDIYYADNNIKFKDGNAIFVLDKKDTLVKLAPYEIDSNYLKQNNIPFSPNSVYPFKYTCGLIWSNQEYMYGYFELKFKSSFGQGIWPAFWLYGGNPNYEIDFFELKGEKKKAIHVDVHCPDKCEDFKKGPLGYRKGWGHWINTKQNLADSFNIVSGEWNEKNIKFYLNGELIAYYNRSFNLPMSLILNTSVAKDGGPFNPGPNKNTNFPSEFVVDYVRVWKNQTEVKARPSIPPELLVSYNTRNKATGLNHKASEKLKYFNSIKKKENEMVTVSIVPVKEKKILVTVLSLYKPKGEILLTDKNNPLVQRTEILRAGETLIDLANFPSTEAQLTIRTGKKTIKETIQIK